MIIKEHMLSMRSLENKKPFYRTDLTDGLVTKFNNNSLLLFGETLLYLFGDEDKSDLTTMNDNNIAFIEKMFMSNQAKLSVSNAFMNKYGSRIYYYENEIPDYIPKFEKGIKLFNFMYKDNDEKSTMLTSIHITDAVRKQENTLYALSILAQNLINLSLPYDMVDTEFMIKNNYQACGDIILPKNSSETDVYFIIWYLVRYYNLLKGIVTDDEIKSYYMCPLINNFSYQKTYNDTEVLRTVYINIIDELIKSNSFETSFVVDIMRRLNS